MTQKQAEHGNQRELTKQRRALIHWGLPLLTAQELLVVGGDGVTAVVISRCTFYSHCQNDTYTRRAAKCHEWQSETSSTKICRQIHVDFDERSGCCTHPNCGTARWGMTPVVAALPRNRSSDQSTLHQGWIIRISKYEFENCDGFNGWEDQFR